MKKKKTIKNNYNIIKETCKYTIKVKKKTNLKQYCSLHLQWIT